jgi:hypothetical protein
MEIIPRFIVRFRWWTHVDGLLIPPAGVEDDVLVSDVVLSRS